MKQKLLIMIMTGILLGSSLSGCGKFKDNNENLNVTQKEVSNKVDNSELSENKNSNKDSQISELMRIENDIFVEHQEVWDKIFAQIDKEKAAEKMKNGQSYVEILNDYIEQTKESIKEDEITTLQEDIKKIEEIEKKIDEIGK